MEIEIEMLKEKYAREEVDMKILIGQDISRENAVAKITKEIATQRQVDR